MEITLPKININDLAILGEGRDHKRKGGFFDLPKDTSCKHREHNPPTHICIPQGKGYRHICPGCGKVHELIPSQVSLKSWTN